MNARAGKVFLAAVGIALVAMFGAVLWRYLQSVQAPPPARQAAAVPVTAEAVQARPFADRIDAIGNLRANESITVTAAITEVVRALHFDSGAQVRAGDVLAEMASAEEAADLEAARADVLEAEQNFARVRDLKQRELVPQSELDQALRAQDSARARVRAMQARLADHLIRAPFDGVVGLRFVSPGALVRPGDPVVTLDDIGVMKMDFAIPERYVAAVQAGDRLLARSVAYPGREFHGQVDSVDTRVDPATRTVLVRAVLPNEDLALRPGMLLNVELVRNERRRVGVPEVAIVGLGERRFVYVVDGGVEPPVVHTRDVLIGARVEGYAEIAQGLQPGELVVVNGVHRLNEGSAVRVVNEAAPDAPVAASAP